MKVVLIVKEIKVKGYYRKNGSWVSPHIRILRVTPKNQNVTNVYPTKKYNNPHQLEFNFTKED